MRRLHCECFQWMDSRTGLLVGVAYGDWESPVELGDRGGEVGALAMFVVSCLLSRSESCAGGCGRCLERVRDAMVVRLRGCRPRGRWRRGVGYA